MSDFAMIRGFPTDYNAGHFALVGATGSGKTYYAKWLLRTRGAMLTSDEKGNPPLFVFVGSHSAHDWYEEESDGHPVVPRGNVATEWTADARNKALGVIEDCGGGMMLFDDFKGALDYHTDRPFANLCKTIRHIGGQVAVIGHTPADIPPAVKDNITHAVLFFTSNTDAIQKLANAYLGGDRRALRAALNALEENGVVKINVKKNRRNLHIAPPPSESGVATSGVGLDETHNIPVGGGAQGPVSLGSTAISGRHVAVAGNATYNDDSVNNQFVQVSQDIRAQVQQNQVTYNDIRARADLSMEIDEKRLHHQARMDNLRNHTRVRELLLKPWLSGAERDETAGLLACALGDNTVTPYNMFSSGRDVDFMESYYPAMGYVGRPEAMSKALTYAPMATAVFSGDRGNMMGEMFKAFAPRAASFVQTAVARHAPRRNSEMHPAAKKRTMREARARRGVRRVRDLFVSRPRRSSGLDVKPALRVDIIAALRLTLKSPADVDDSNWKEFTLRLLKKHFPSDFEREVRLVRQRS